MLVTALEEVEFNLARWLLPERSIVCMSICYHQSKLLLRLSNYPTARLVPAHNQTEVDATAQYTTMFYTAVQTHCNMELASAFDRNVTQSSILRNNESLYAILGNKDTFLKIIFKNILSNRTPSSLENKR